jgi:hypothetical protein
MPKRHGVETDLEHIDKQDDPRRKKTAMNPNKKYDENLTWDHEKTMLEAKSIHPENLVG